MIGPVLVISKHIYHKRRWKLATRAWKSFVRLAAVHAPVLGSAYIDTVANSDERDLSPYPSSSHYLCTFDHRTGPLLPKMQLLLSFAVSLMTAILSLQVQAAPAPLAVHPTCQSIGSCVSALRSYSHAASLCSSWLTLTVFSSAPKHTIHTNTLSSSRTPQRRHSLLLPSPPLGSLRQRPPASSLPQLFLKGTLLSPSRERPFSPRSLHLQSS